MGAVEDWTRLVDATPSLREAFDVLGTRGGDRRSRVRRRAAELDATALTLPDIAWELQVAAADGSVRERIAAAQARRRHAAGHRQATVVAAAGTSVGTGGTSASGRHTAGFVIVLILAFLAPALVMPRFRGGGFVYDVDQVALLSGIASLTLAIVGLTYIARASRPLVGSAVPLILAVWILIAGAVAVMRLVEEPALAGPSAVAGVVLMVVAAGVHLAAAVVRHRRTPATAVAALPADDTEALLADAVSGEEPDAAALRRAGYADGILTLMKRGELDEHDAAHLLRSYAG